MTSELVKRLIYRADTMNGARPVGAGDGGTYSVGYYGPECAKDDMEAAAEIIRLTSALEEAEKRGTFKIGDRVEKIKGSSWRGVIVGTYSTRLTPEGYAVESENEPGSVQIYPAAALSAMVKL